ncbi:MAG: hypothetical protein PVG89_15360, partial [Gammaproteobacteria bacterium]
MKTRLKRYLALLLCSGCFYPVVNISHAAFTYDPSLDWYTLHTEHFEVHYHNGEEQLANKAAAIAEQAHQRVTNFFQWQPKQRTQLVLVDRMDFSNAFAIPIPRNTMHIFVSPPDDANDIDNYHDWLELVITHEYTHIVHVDKVAGTAKAGRNVFGRQILFFPNALQPTWVLEGIATYVESQLAPGIGRGHNTSFRSLMRLEVKSGIKPLRQVNQPVVSWPAGSTRYLYGVYFFNFLMDTYGEQKVQEWVSNYSDNLIPFMLNSNARRVFKKDLDTLWSEFTEYLNKEFQPQIRQIENEGIVDGKQVTQFGYLTGYPRAAPNGDLYFVKQDWLSKPALMVLPKGQESPREVAEVYSGRFDLHPQRGALVAQIDLVDNVNYFSDLHQIDINSGEMTQLTKGQRYKHAVWSPDGDNIIAVQVSSGRSSLDLLTAQGDLVETLWQSDGEDIVSDLDWSPDGTQLIASVWRPETRWNLELFNIADGTWQKITDTIAIEFDPRFIDNGQTVIYSADYDGVFNVYRMTLATGQVEKLTNVTGSALSASYSETDNGVYYMGQHPQGTDVYFIPQQQFAAKTINLDDHPGDIADSPGERSTNNMTVATTEPAPYSALGKIRPTAWFPYIEISEDRSEWGANIFGADPLNWHQYNLTAVYDTENG